MSGQASRKSRLVDVAKLAGVSLGSASKALSTPGSVRPKTLQLVREAAARLGYIPDGSGRALALGRTFSIGTVLPTVNNPIFSDFVHALQKQLRLAGYQLLTAAHEYDRAEEFAIVEALIRRGVDGLVLVGTQHDPEVYRAIESSRMPLVLTWSVDDSPTAPCIGIHNRRAMRPVVQHLLELGHRHFAVLSGNPVCNERARGRIDGVVDSLASANIVLPAQNVIHCAFAVSAGREGLRTALTLRPRPTALIACTDQLAAGALAEAASLGVRVPEQLSITGFDDVEFAALLEPALTTVRVPASEMGRLAAQRVLQSIEGGSGSLLGTLDTSLIVRRSSGPAMPGSVPPQ